MAKHCPICNRSNSEVEFYGEFCKYCAQERLAEKLPKEILIEKCSRCGRIKAGGRYVKETGMAINTIMRSKIPKYGTKFIEMEGDSAVVDVIDNETGASTEKSIKLDYNGKICEACYRKAGMYYEAVMQLRGDTDKVERMISKVNKYFERHQEFVTKVEQVDNGYDMYLSSKKLVTAFLSLMNIKATVSYTLHGLRKGKKIYRNTYSIRL